MEHVKQLTEEQTKELMKDAEHRLLREQEERERNGMHGYQHLVGLAERRVSHCAIFAKREA
jgi:hypothetical protein